MLLQTNNITKVFGGHKALDNVNVTFEAGTVHSLLGENGAGKSTLIKILTGVYQQTSGQIIWEGKEVNIERPKAAQDLGINVIHQDRQLVPYFTGLENLFLNKTYPKKVLGGIHWKRMREQANALKDKWKIDIPVDKPVYDMTPTERTMLEILRAMSQESKVLVLDEPTASLTDKESVLLFSLIDHLKKEGVAIIYISHRLEEVIQISDYVTVLTGGKVTASLTKDEITREKIIYHMTDGQQMNASKKEKADLADQQVLLTVSNLATKDDKVKDVSFNVHAGEIVGMYGLAGAGRTESMEAIFGLREKSNGEVVYKEKSYNKVSPKQMIKEGMILIPENRHDEGLIMPNTISHNMTLPILNEVSSGGVLTRKKESEKVQGEMKRFKVKAVSANQTVAELSGGNQQKVVFGKALLTNPDLYICDEPTQAVDIMTRNDIHSFLQEQASNGKGIIFVSSDIQEILEVSDRIIVFSEGKTVADLKNKDIDNHTILDICYQHQKGEN
ncbi:sugar ABC transporter ATP-binding protein [Pseudogracilibacillus sp. SE30717A]|uniref:sugar ABC transporter ATP-binding protein n=1 Tax=Pseudogracilibacillus sp. SE30717A TaxID=3098293 RepID=UPI00300DCF60